MIEHTILPFILSWPSYVGYGVVFLLMIVEGDIALFTFSFLASQGSFQVGYLTMSVFFGALLGDVVWYSLGRYILEAPMLQWLKAIVERMARPINQHLQERPFHTLFLTKFTYGIHHAILARAGMMKNPLRTLLKTDIPAVFCWMMAIGSLGYFSGASFGSLKHYLKLGEVIFLSCVILFIVLERVLRNKVKARL